MNLDGRRGVFQQPAKRWTFGQKQGHLFRLRCGIEPRRVLLPDDFVPAFGWL